MIKKGIWIILLFSPIVYGTGQADLAGKYDDGNLYIITSLDYSWKTTKFERDIEFDYRYQDKNNITINQNIMHLL